MNTELRSRDKLAGVLDVVLFGGLLVFLLGLPFHLVIKWAVPDPAGTYWKEFLLGLLVLIWIAHAWLARRPLLTRTGLDWAVLFYLGLLVVRFVLDGLRPIGAWGLYVSVMYLPLFWVVASVLRNRPGRLVALLSALVAVGAAVSVGGLLEFVWDRPLWPSVEIMQRQGFPGVFIYGTHIRRVYFTFDSPTTLANTLAMLLPSALALVLVARRLILRLAAALAGVLMAACIVVTFSRGIWVATVFSLVVMAALIVLTSRTGRGLVRSALKPAAVAAGALAVLAVVWAVVWLSSRPDSSSVPAGVVELSRADYDTAPVTAVGEDLTAARPIWGEVVSQTWSILDPIDGGQDVRPVLYQHPPATGQVELIYVVDVPQGGALRFAAAMSPDVWSPEKGDGASFQVLVTPADQGRPPQGVFERYINPKLNIADRRWRNFLIDLSSWAGRSVRLSLIIDAGRAHDWNYDWAGWGRPQIVSLPPGYFTQKPGNAITRHAGSILDWARDETNRDRLAAWSLSLSAMRSAPLWGTGLGSTGVAALRVRPEVAFVTESQVLKALVELGPLGLLALLFIGVQIARTGYRAWRADADARRRVLLLGVLVGLLVVMFEGVVYQNMEAKQVNAYFWTFAGCVAFLAAHPALSPETE